MGKFERKLKKELKKDVQGFDEWFIANRSKLCKFEEKPRTEQVVRQGQLLVKSKQIWLSVVAVSIVLTVGLLMILSFGLLNKKDVLTFNEDFIRYEKTSDNEKNKLIEQNMFLNKIIITDTVNAMHIDDDSLVATIVTGEIETENNFYLCKFTFIYNNNFKFGAKGVYDDLDGNCQKDAYVVYYSTEGIPFDGWFKNYILLETKEEQRIYIELECMTDDLTYILTDVL